MQVVKEPLADGIYPDISEARYHADLLCDVPTLSSSMCKTLVTQTAQHCWLNAPRLNPHFEPSNKQQFDLGSAAHAVLLGQKHLIVEAKGFDDWRKDAAKAIRDNAYATGKIPVLSHQLAEINAMANAARRQLDQHEDCADAFTNGRPEVTLIWTEETELGAVRCRARLDWLSNPREDGSYPNITFDYKSTATDIGPEAWGKRTLFDMGADIQSAFYSRGIRKLLKVSNPVFVFIVQENDPPHCLIAHTLIPEAMADADFKAQRAIQYFAWCRHHNKWPGYPRRLNWLDLPPWRAKEAEHRRQIDAKLTREEQEEFFRLGIEMQSPLEE